MNQFKNLIKEFFKLNIIKKITTQPIAAEKLIARIIPIRVATYSTRKGIGYERVKC